ncbi:hypothetical protein PPACK8108_LOCUS13002 [Phakopsora pachyrhizi]|uniref:Uncharacterized protein n=1 Tax=Phakopsora pachyrhizi TaxID=170000 RepID=A0AAV0B2P5_PHAPC|nr:hypothetical protein PPACK8108_LOCUS13002 [Phakopsora pachyrhizi]
MSGMMKKITRESKLSLQVDTYDNLGTKCYIETGWATAFNFTPHELLNCSKIDAVVTNQTTKVDTSQVLMMKKTRSILSKVLKDDLIARDPTDQLVEGPYCQTEVVQVKMKLRARQSSLDGMGEVRFRPDWILKTFLEIFFASKEGRNGGQSNVKK